MENSRNQFKHVFFMEISLYEKSMVTLWIISMSSPWGISVGCDSQ